MSIKQILNNAIAQLSKTSTTPRLDAELLLGYILHKSRDFLYLHDDEALEIDEIENFNELVKQRLRGKPIAYLVGHKAFWTLDLIVNESVLIPRPETELLVEIILQKFSATTKLKVADLGTGSGAIALSLAYERPLWQIVATDLSQSALDIAKKNAQKYNLAKVTFCLSDWLTALPQQKFDVIVSNPPYIAEGDLHLLAGIRYEPQAALISGPQGLDALTVIIENARNVLLPGGMLIFEHGFDQRLALFELMEKNGYVKIRSYKDLAGCDRVMSGIIND